MKKVPKNYLMLNAFTLIELVFVIVVVGILAAAIIPRIQTNPVKEAAIQLLSHIRYTQHLAMVDDKYNSNDPAWFKKRWQIAFISSKKAAYGPSYTIYADTSNNSTGDANEVEIALNPLNKNQRLTGGHSGDKDLDVYSDSFVGMKKLNLKLSYGIKSLTLSKSCKVYGSKRIYFDYLGRPIKGKLGKSNNGGNTKAYERKNLIQENCSIKLSNANTEVIINITPETGYSCIMNSENTACI
jgi:prepilin-type N-terminal cleavage/methylation domain-containing protein